MDDTHLACIRGIRGLTIDGPPYEMAYIPAEWAGSKTAFYRQGRAMVRVAQQTAKAMGAELKTPVVLAVTTWRELGNRPRGLDGATGGYRIYRLASLATPVTPAPPAPTAPTSTQRKYGPKGSGALHEI
jgi:hypothetical protein